MDRPTSHPVYRWKQTTRRELAREAAKHRDWQRALDLKWKRIGETRLAEKNAATRARWSKHIAAQSASRTLKW